MIVIMALGYIFIPDKIVFIPCSVISGLFFIQLSIDNLLNIYELKKREAILDIIFYIIIGILAFFYQMYHLNRKKKKHPVLFMRPKSLLKKILT